ncbi:hypothetical protein [Agromyces arachidis]|uniref:hypothetical protein n=1 Tax=Agromyces arachidis TaxID=766966 RepID=UPI0040577138
MFDHRKPAAALGGAALAIALAGCAGVAGTASGSVELHQDRARPAGTQALEMQGTRLAEYADALAAASGGAAEAQGQRLAEYADALAGSGAG